MNHYKRPAALTTKDDKNLSYQEIFDELDKDLIK